jgi:protein-disulfide isomerase
MDIRPRTLAVPVGHYDHVLGPASAPVTVVEYGDFECPACKRAYPGVKMLLAGFERAIRFVYRHFPLVQIPPHAELAAEAAEAAGAQGRFWRMHSMLFENKPSLQPHHLRSHALGIGLDLQRYDLEMANHVHLERVREHVATGIASGVRGTPSFFVNGTYQDVSFGFEHLIETVRRQLAMHANRSASSAKPGRYSERRL